MNPWRLWDRIRCAFLPRAHRRRIGEARRVLAKVRPWLKTGPKGPARVFGYLRTIDPLVFEELVLQAFVDQRFRIRRGTRYSGDGGVDGHVRLGEAWAPLQCKRYAGAIDPQHVLDFARLTFPRRAVFAHTGRTGPQSHATRDARVIMLSGNSLLALIAGTFSLDSE